MLTRRSKINSSSCSQIVSSHFVTIHSWSVCPAEDRKNQSVNLFWELRVFQNRRMLIRPKNSSLVLVAIDNMPMLMPICNRYWDTATYWQMFPIPFSFNALVRGDLI